MKLLPALLICLASSPMANAQTTIPPRLTADQFRQSLKPVGFVMKEPGFHIWCNSPVYAPDGKCHSFVSRWPMSANFGNGWWTVCEIARYEAPSPEGPWVYKETILKGSGQKGHWRGFAPHNPAVLKLSDGRYALTFIANDSGEKTKDRMSFPANQKIGLMLADQPEGPWKLAGKDGLIFSPPEDPAIWSHDSAVGVNNPSLMEKDGKYYLYYKAMLRGPNQHRKYSLAVADQVEGPYIPQPKPLTENKGGIEDGDAFRLNGRITLITTDSTNGGGWLWSSDDGVRFDPAPVRAYDNLKAWVPAEELKSYRHNYSPFSMERPKILRNPKTGEPAYLFVASATAPADDAGSRPFLFRIEPHAK